eukprot:5062433-Prymnesium_polylepis.1
MWFGREAIDLKVDSWVQSVARNSCCQLVTAVSTTSGGGRLLHTAQKPPIAWSETVMTSELGGSLVGSTAPPLNSGAKAWRCDPTSRRNRLAGWSAFIV